MISLLPFGGHLVRNLRNFSIVTSTAVVKQYGKVDGPLHVACPFVIGPSVKFQSFFHFFTVHNSKK